MDIIEASRLGRVDRVRELIRADPNVVHVNADQPLIEAVTNQHVEVVKVLLSKGAWANARNDESLMIAAANGNAEILILLLDAGADVHARDNQAVDIARDNGHEHIVDLLEFELNVINTDEDEERPNDDLPDEDEVEKDCRGEIDPIDHAPIPPGLEFRFSQLNVAFCYNLLNLHEWAMIQGEGVVLNPMTNEPISRRTINRLKEQYRRLEHGH